MGNINPNLEIPELEESILQVISACRPVEKEFSAKDGSRFQLRILPYRTPEGKVEGALITLANISPRNRNS